MVLPKISREDAFLVFEKWLSEETALVCLGAFFGCSFTVVGKVVLVKRDRVEVCGADPRCNAVLRLDVEDCEFWYAEPKDFPVDVPEYAKSSGTVCVSLPFRVSPAEFEADILPPREKLFFMELREDTER